MVSTLSGTCKGIVNIFQPEDDEFYKAAIIIIEEGITEEQVRAFREWWPKNGYYEGKPAVKSLLMEIGNSIEGVEHARTHESPFAHRSWQECNLWITRDIQVKDFDDPLTLQIIQQIGEGTMRQLSNTNVVQIRQVFFDLYGDLAKQNGA